MPPLFPGVPPQRDRGTPQAQVTTFTRRHVAEQAPIVLDCRSESVLGTDRSPVPSSHYPSGQSAASSLPHSVANIVGITQQLYTPQQHLYDGQESEVLPQVAVDGRTTPQQGLEPRETPSGRVSLHGIHSYQRQSAQRERHRQRYFAQRRRATHKSMAGWVWLKVTARMRKSTVFFFEAVDGGRVDIVRDMVRSQPGLLLRTRPGTRWTAVHHTAERGEFATLTALFEEAQRCDRASASGRGMLSCATPRASDFVKRMVNGLTEKNLTPLMLACKRGCVLDTLV